MSRLWTEQPSLLVRPLALARPSLAADMARVRRAALGVVREVTVKPYDWAAEPNDDCDPHGIERPGVS